MSTVKVFAAIPKRPDISDEEFQDHWRHPHGTLCKKITTLRRYVQSHRIKSPLVAPYNEHYDGITELWYDNVDDATGLVNEPNYIKYNLPDEPLYVDLPNLKYVFTTEEVISSRPDVNVTANEADAAWSPWGLAVCIKLIQLVEPQGNADWARADDADLGRRIGALRHVRSHPLESVHGREPPFRGVRELWWPTMWACKQGVAADPEAYRSLMLRAGKSNAVLAQAELII